MRRDRTEATSSPRIDKADNQKHSRNVQNAIIEVSLKLYLQYVQYCKVLSLPSERISIHKNIYFDTKIIKIGPKLSCLIFKNWGLAKGGWNFAYNCEGDFSRILLIEF